MGICVVCALHFDLLWGGKNSNSSNHMNDSYHDDHLVYDCYLTIKATTEDGAVHVNTQPTVQITRRTSSAASTSASVTVTTAALVSKTDANMTWSNDTSSNISADVVSTVAVLQDKSKPPTF